jgi:hypothetical protein
MTDVGLTASAQQADNSPPPDSPILPGFLQVRCEGDLLRAGGFYWAKTIVAIGVCTSVVIVAAELGLSVVGISIVAAFLVVSSLAASLELERRRVMKRVKELATQAEPSALTPALCDIADAIQGPYAPRGLRIMVAALHAKGLAGATIRLCSDAAAPPLPLAVPFEPQLLDETSSALMQQDLNAAVGSQVAHQSPAIRSGVRSSSARWVWRKIVLRGGWLMLVIYVFNWCLHLVDALRHWRCTPMFALWTVGLGWLLFLPGWRQIREQWFLVPGAVVVRKAPWLRGDWKLHLFERGKSVLCVGPTRRRGWLVAVADDQQQVQSAVTRAEADFLLRAWLSPIPPPSADKLTDLE